jgi:hypothetical protein
MREPSELTELERAIVARSKAGESRRAICKALGVTADDVRHAEWVIRYDAERRRLFAECPDSIEGMAWIGELSGKARDALVWHQHRHEGPSPTRMSEVAALGRLYVSHIKGIGPKGLASIDHVLEMLGIAWSPIDRMPKPKRREPERQQPERSEFWNDIIRRVAEIEGALGTAVLKNHQGRDSMEGVSYRLAFLTGYIESKAEYGGWRDMRDITPEPEQDDGEYETAGNLICLPGVKLADVRPNDESRP